MRRLPPSPVSARPPSMAAVALVALAALAVIAGCASAPTEAPPTEATPFPVPTELRDLPDGNPPEAVPRNDGTVELRSGSAPIEPGIAYRYEAITHCGLRVTTFDVDGTFWDVVGPANEGQFNPPRGLDNPVDAGVFALTAPDRAVWTSRAGVRVDLVRGDPGPRVEFLCD